MEDESMWGKLYFDTGELSYEGFIKDKMPCGVGVSYFKNGNKHFEGIFADWFIEIGREFYENGVLRYEGVYNKGPRTYYGPRYFTKGKLYREDGTPWFDGVFLIFHSFSVGMPLYEGEKSFYQGIIYHEDGTEEIIDKPYESFLKRDDGQMFYRDFEKKL
ncbi:MAG: hypothetical protein WC677_02505 [Clostridia bacterium]|jgi:hypothetical protein